MQTTTLSHVTELLETMRKLRSAQGCEWDRSQTPQSLRPYILEEAYELVDAIDQQDSAEICSELGDLLLQIVFQAQIFSERGEFDFVAVAKGINAKLVRRHPHIFCEDTEGDHPSWEEIKQQELVKKGKSPQLSARIPSCLPALKQAAKVSRYLNNLRDKTPTAKISAQSKEAQLGERIYALVCEAEKDNIDAELALRSHLQQLLDHQELSKGNSDS